MTTYTVQMHDGRSWDSVGIRLDPNKGVPVACSSFTADTGSREEMEQLKEFADRVCGGTLRVVATIDGWTWSTDPPAVAGWFAVLLSHEEDSISTQAMFFTGGRARTFTAGTLIAHAGPLPDQTTAEAWGYYHDPDDPD
jgi:hypothetical protein